VPPGGIPALIEPPELLLTVIIPAYNEVLRIESTLRNYQAYFDTSRRWKGKTSILVVDDGSRDGTLELVQELAKSSSSSSLYSSSSSTTSIACCSLAANGGKGAALAHGIATAVGDYKINNQSASGLIILTADADGSAEIADVERLFDAMLQILIGSSSSSNSSQPTSACWTTPILINGYRLFGILVS
jgi:dolichyl-phosphate beta-glucosyltransferase